MSGQALYDALLRARENAREKDWPGDVERLQNHIDAVFPAPDLLQEGVEPVLPNPDADIQRLMTAVSNMLFGDMEHEFRELEQAAAPFIDMHTGEPFVGWWKPDAEGPA